MDAPTPINATASGAPSPANDAAPRKFGLGASIQRLEDETFITGRGRYTDDVQRPGQLHAAVVRSPHASARFTIVDVEAAKAAPGVHLVLTGEDVADLKPLKTSSMKREPDGSKRPTRDIPILCAGDAHYVGDAVAFVVADTAAQAKDAAELVEVEWHPREACVGTARALDDGAPLVWPELETNFAYSNEMGDRAATDAAFETAARTTTIRFRNNRLVANYIETRAANAEVDEASGRIILTLGTQGVHDVRNSLVRTLGIDKDALRVVTPDVGGGFGTKIFCYREYALVCEAARRLKRPVKWTCDRTEHFLTDSHGRDNAVEASMAMDADGRFLGLRIDLVANMGAYLHQEGPFIPYLGGTMATGVYDIPAAFVHITGVYTNTPPVDAYRGAGRPEAAFLIERLVDECARDLGIGPVEIRRRNFIAPDQFPYDTPVGRTYERCEFDGHLTRALELSDYAGFEARRADSARDGKYRGIGLATYIEACAFAGSEPAFLELKDDGTVELRIGTQSNGQGHATAYAQIAAEQLGVPMERIVTRQGDTDELDEGGGTGGSRSVPLGGPSVNRAAKALAQKIRKLASDRLEVAEGDIELVDGVARVVGTDKSLDLADIAARAESREDVKADGVFEQDQPTYPNGTHVVELEIDPATGSTELLRYTIVDDFGVTVNPLLLQGQVHGGAVQGIGQCLTEHAVFAEDGQPITASFMDYGVPRADLVPSFTFETRNVPSTTNALGIKGAGEAGTIGSCPAVMNALVSALEPTGIRHVEMPVTPGDLWTALQAARVEAAE